MAMTISQCLVAERPDMAVSLWLQDKAGNMEPGSMPREVVVAHRADRFLVEVNSGGFDGFFSWERDGVMDTIPALTALGLADTAETLKQAIELFAPDGWPATPEQFEDAHIAYLDDDERSGQVEALAESIMNDSKRIEVATHAYVRAQLSVFEQLDA